MKRIILCFAILSFFTATSQNNFYVDNLFNADIELSKKEQLNQILDVPYDQFIGNILASEKMAHKAIELASELNDQKSLAEAYLLLAQVYSFQDKREKKLTFHLKAIDIFERIGTTERAGYSYGELGFSLKRQNLNNGLYYMRKGLALLNKSNKDFKVDATFDNYGILQGMLKNYDSAIFYHNKSLRLKKIKKDSIGIPFGYVHLATVNIQLKNFEIAKKYIDSAHNIRLNRNDVYGITDDFVYYGDLYFAQKKYLKAIENFKKGYDLSLKNNFHSLRKYCADYLTKSYLALNDYKNAFYFNNIHQTLKDSTLNSNTNQHVAELQIEFETEKKEIEITRQKEQLLKQELALKNRNLYSIVLGSGFLILCIISFGLYKRSQHKKREYLSKLNLKEAQTHNKLQDQRLRISRDLHDNIGSQLTFIISSIDNLKFQTKNSNSTIKNKLTEINQFANNTITQLRDTIWAMNKNEISYEDFQGRILKFIEKAKTISNLKINFNSNVKSDISFSSIKGINIFRVIQESLNNTLKYANASIVNVSIFEDNENIFITISDNGKGFDKKKVELGNGLENMQKRINEVGGTIDIKSKHNKGTTISISCNKNKTNAV